MRLGKIMTEILMKIDPQFEKFVADVNSFSWARHCTGV